MSGVLSRSRRLFSIVLVSGVIVVGVARADDLSGVAPSNAELHRMILELQGNQQRLEQEAAAAKQEAAAAKAELARTQQQLQDAVAGTPDVSAGPAADTGFIVAAEALYWDASRDGLDYAMTDANGGSDPLKGDVKRLDPDWNAGFRGELGYRAGNGLDILVRGMFFDTDADDSETDIDGYLTGTRIYLPDSVVEALDAEFASAEYDIDLWMIDLESGYWFQTLENLRLRPFAAFRYASIEQDMSSMYCGGRTCEFGADEIDVVDQDVDWWGAGLMLGLDGDWNFWRGFSLFGRGAVGVLGGKYESNFSYYDGLAEEGQIDADDNDSLFTPVFEAKGGVGYRILDRDRFALEFQTGYEFMSFLNSPDFLTFDGDDEFIGVESGDVNLMFHGAFFRLMGRF